MTQPITRGAGPATSGPQLVKSRPVTRLSVKAGNDTDTATRQTVEMMCDFIREAIADPWVQQCARYAFDHFGRGVNTDSAKAWAVFWYVKHCLKFRNDEATMYRVGLDSEQDLLISPSVLLRMKNPAEDCDGFTMVGAAMLAILGVPVYIATVAASPEDRSRWSHVFPVAMVSGQVLPLDMSHGKYPGWMVPKERTYRFQAWTLDGKPTSDIAPSKFQGLHGYVRAGLGDFYDDFANYFDDGSAAGNVTTPGYTGYTADSIPSTVSLPLSAFGGAGAGTVPTTPTPTGSAPNNAALWNLFGGIANQASSLIRPLITPPAYTQSTYNPTTGQYSNTTIAAPGGSPGTALTAGLSIPGVASGGSNILMLGLAAVALVVVLSAGKK